MTPTDSPDAPLLEIRDLRIEFRTEQGTVRAVNSADLTIRKGRVLGLVGESGSGKTVTALSIMRLIPSPPGRITGSIRFKGTEVLSLPMNEIYKLRGSEISMIFQEPMSALNPVYTVGDQIEEVVRLHREIPESARKNAVLSILRDVGIPSPEDRVRSYPFELSGGMSQRIMIAMALICEPSLLIADEPTTALDVTVQAQILDLIRDLKDRFGSAVLFITHDLAVVSELADDVAVMYAGTLLEKAPAAEIFREPLHPYTQGLLECVPRLGMKKELREIPGRIPDLTDLPDLCPFLPRCTVSIPRCRGEMPLLEPVGNARSTRCFLYQSNPGGGRT